MTRKTSTALFALLILALSGCAEKHDLSRCQPATDKQMDFIAYAIRQEQPSNSVGQGWAVKSGDFVNVYMVAARIYGPGIESGTDPAVWAVGGDPDSPHTWLAVDGLAKNFTQLPDASQTDAAITLSADGVDLARQCVVEFEP